jgi:hypothetical protein
MAGPITWRNIQTPGPSYGATQGIASAGNAITTGFDRLAGIVDSQEALETKRIDRGLAADREGFLNLLSGARSVEDLAALRASGVIDQRFAALDPREQAKVRDAEQARLAGLRGETTARQTFETAQRDLREAPIRDRIMALLATDPKAALAELQANPGIRNAAPIAAAIAAGERDATKWGWAQRDQRFRETNQAATEAQERSRIEREMRESRLAPERETLLTQQVRSGERAEAAAALAATQATRDAVIAQQEQTARADLNPYLEGGALTDQAAPTLSKLMADRGIGDPDDRQAVINRLARFKYKVTRENGTEVEVPVPLSVVTSAILGAKVTSTWVGSNNVANRVEKAIKDRMDALSFDYTDPKNPKARQDLVRQFEQFQQIEFAKGKPASEVVTNGIPPRSAGVTALEAAATNRLGPSTPPVSAKDSFMRLFFSPSRADLK